MSKPTDIQVRGTRLFFLPVQTRVPLKFGAETLTSVMCARVSVTVSGTGTGAAQGGGGTGVTGWGETPLSVQWVWPSRLPVTERLAALMEFCRQLAAAWAAWPEQGHALEIGHAFLEHRLPGLLEAFNRARGGEPMPWLAALVCCSPFDLALHDAFGKACARPVYETYHAGFLSRDLASWIEPAPGSRASFAGRFPADFLPQPPARQLRVWHLVGGVDPIDRSELTGAEPQDGYPVLLEDWIRRDGLQCLKIKLRGNDEGWDYDRIVRVGQLGCAHAVEWLSADFNCTVQDPEYVNAMLDRLRDEHPRIHGMILYVEQPFAYELERDRTDVRSVSARKPLFLDESAHDWRMVRLGRELGWSGVALKTCKTQTGALLSACWARAHGMTLMVQDLTNPMLAMVPHVQLAAHAGTILGVECNAMQFYPEASLAEAALHPGIYQRRNGRLDLSTLAGPGLGYAGAEMLRDPGPPAAEYRA